MTALNHLLFFLCLALFGVGCGKTIRPVEERGLAEAAPVGANSLSAQWGAFLATEVDEGGRLDYEALAEDRSSIESIYQMVAEQSPDSNPDAYSNTDARFAYWLNAYNIAVVYGVLEQYPLESVLEVKPISPYSIFTGGGFFAAQKFVFGGRPISLYNLENDLIRKRFSDPRLHFALNCASLSCPVLPQYAFNGADLDAQLERETVLFIHSEQNFQIDSETEQIRLSAIFKWYEVDFINALIAQGVEEPKLTDYVAPYLERSSQEALRRAIERDYELVFLPYDWGLNDR